jgi:PAS domain S-box-containing protein
MPLFQRALCNGEPAGGIHHTIEWPDGQYTQLTLDLMPLHDEAGCLRGTVVTLAETSPSAVGSLSDHLYVELFAGIPLGLHVYHLDDPDDDRSLRLAALNTASAEAMDIARADLIGKTLDECFPSLRDQEVPQRFAKAVRSGKSFEMEVSVRGDDRIRGDLLTVLAFPLSGDYLGVSIRDITERKRAADAVRESEQRLNLHVQHTPLGVIDWDINFCVRRWNPAAERIFGYTAQEAEGRHAVELFIPESARAHVDQIWRDLLAQKGGTRSTNENVTKDGRVLTCEWYNTPLVDADGKVIGVASLVEDVSDRVRVEEAQRRDVERLHTLLDSIPAGVMLIDAASHQIVYVNPFAERMIGSSREAMIGVICHRYVCPAEVGRCPITDLGERVDNTERELCTPSGARVPILKTVVPVTLDNRSYLLESFFDISDRKQAEAQTEASREAAESANRAKSAFLANMSHEIRTPMNAIMGLTDLVLDGQLNADQRRRLEMVQGATTGLLHLINDILDFSKIEAGRLELEELDFSLADLVQEVINIVALRAHERSVELSHTIDPLAPSQLKGDPGRLRQILFNLVGNAVKFTEEGSVRIRIELAEETGDQVRLRTTVTDTGIGIPADKLGALFDAFTQADASTTRTHGGTGLGLAISKRLANMLGGEIGVESEEGRGSTFWFTAVMRKQSSAKGETAA